MKNRTTKIALYLAILAIIAMLFGFLTPTTKIANASQATRGIALIDGESGTLIYGENPDQIKPMASTTKIFTAYFVIEKCEADNINTEAPRKIKSEWTGIEGSSIYLMPNEEVSIKELLYGLMLRSGNDSAVALSEIAFGSGKAYLEYANARLKELGYTKTALQNPHGLPAENHYTTARELAKFSAFAMKNPTFKKIVSSKTYKGERTLYLNKNKILQTVEGGNGIKTGYTKSAGRCLVSGAERNGNQVVLAVLNTYDMFERSKALIDNFFATHEYIDITKDLKAHAIPLDIPNVTAEISLPNKTTKIPVPKGANVKIEIKTVSGLPFYTKNGTFVGNIAIYAENRLIFSEKLYTIKTCNSI